MGFDKSRFSDECIDEELICPICSGILEEPLQIPACEHDFCSECIKTWLDQQQTCPVCRSFASTQELKPASRILRNLLSRLNIVCENAHLGCNATLKFDALNKHKDNCEFSPTRLIVCEKGCALRVPKNEMESHNCIRELRSHFENKIQKLEQKCAEMELYTERLKSIPAFNMSMGAHLNWYHSLARARVLRWGGLISTPDEPNQENIKATLTRLGCPFPVLNELIRNSHERNWPEGLSTLEIRQINRSLFDNYTVRKLPNLQVVVIMAAENQQMRGNMILEPGIAMTFAHGVEEI